MVIEALYYHIRGEKMYWPGFGHDAEGEEISSAIEDDYLQDTGEGIEIVEQDPKISKAIDALEELQTFIENIKMESQEFEDWYVNEYDHRLVFDSKRFWSTHLK
jgi:hypothetical protein